MSSFVDGGTAVALGLEALGVTTAFAVPSAHNMPILRAIEQRGAIRVIGCRHEQGVAHAADAYARTSGSLGVAIVSGGPGTANAMGGMYEAHHASSPVLLITSQVESAHIGRGRGYVHEAESQAEMLHTVCREVSSVTMMDDIAETVVRLGVRGLTGRPRPVAIEIPVDVQDAAVDGPDTSMLACRARVPLRRLPPPAAEVEEAARLLAAAERPVIWAGGGVLRSGAAAALKEFAECWQAPVVTSREGRGAISELDALSIGGYATLPPMWDYLAGCDAMLAVGTRFQMYPTAQWQLPLPKALVHLDTDPTVIGRSYVAAVPVIADARLGLRALTAALPELPEGDRLARKDHIRSGQTAAAAARDVAAAQAGPDHLEISRIVAEHRRAAGVLVCDATVPAFVWGDRLAPIVAARTSVRSTAAGIGPGMAFALGAAAASDEHVVLLQGDGGFMLGVGELASAVQSRAKVVVCLFDDGGYGMLRDIQARTGEGHPGHFDLATPDFHDLARAFGARAHRVSDPAGFESAFVQALAHDGPTLIHIQMRAMAPLRRSLGT